MKAWVASAGLWATGYASARAWLAGAPDPSVAKPPCALVDSRLLRATSVATRVCIEAASQALTEAALDPATTPTVFGSWHGEIQIAIEQIEVIRNGDGLVSPARFRNSVHNTASGVLGIATKNRGFTTAIAAGAQTFAMSLLEALALLGAGAHAVVVTVGEEPLPPRLSACGELAAMGISFALTASPPTSGPALGAVGVPRACAETLPLPARALALSSTAPALALLGVLSHGVATSVPLVVGDASDERWCVDVSPASDASAEGRA